MTRYSIDASTRNGKPETLTHRGVVTLLVTSAEQKTTGDESYDELPMRNLGAAHLNKAVLAVDVALRALDVEHAANMPGRDACHGRLP